VKYATFVPEAMVVAAALVLLLAARFRPAQQRRLRSRLPAAAAIVLLVAFGIELYAGANVGSYFGGGLVQDRLALFAKAVGLLAAAIAIGVADWPAEDSPSLALAMTLFALFGLMVTASAGDVVAVWAGLELAGAAGVGMLAVRRPDLGLRLLLLGAAASAMTLVGLAYVYATAGTADLLGIRQVLLGAAPTLPLALPVLLVLGALAFRAAMTPAQVAAGPVLPPASPLSTGLVVGLVAAAALVAAVKVAAALSPVSGVYSPYLEVVAALAMVGGGSAALAVRTPRARIAFLAAGQAGWVLAGLATHYRGGIGSAVFLLGAFVLAATAGPASMGATGFAEAALAGMGTLRPHRAAALSLAMLSLAGVPPLAGFFGEFAVGSALAQSGHFELLAVGLLGTTLSTVAALGTLRAMYLQNPLDEARRGGAVLPVLTRLSAGAAVALCMFIAAYGLLASPILALADQGAEGLGLK
jgi:NADH-quinone oxidoreductase subunit N